MATSAANLGWQLNGNTQIRGTVHYGVDGTGVPNAWDFYHVADDATQKDQNIFLSALDRQPDHGRAFTTASATDSRASASKYDLWQPIGQLPVLSADYCFGPAYLGNTVTITGANGYSATGQAVLDCAGTYRRIAARQQSRSARLSRRHHHHAAPGRLIGFQYEDERGSEPGSSYYPPVERTNYDYLAAVHGDFKNRFYYTLGGSLEHYSLFGVQTSPRAGVSYYVLRPRSGVFSGTRILFNYGDAVREPTLTDQDDSLYNFLENNGGAIDDSAAAHQSSWPRPPMRTYEGGVEQIVPERAHRLPRQLLSQRVRQGD